MLDIDTHCKIQTTMYFTHLCNAVRIELGLTPENKCSDNVKRIQALNDKLMTRSRYVPGHNIELWN